MTWYNPLTYDNLVNGLVMNFEKQKPIPFTDENVESIDPGPGVYALSYSGTFARYTPVAGGTIYVGKAILGGRRTGNKPDNEKFALRGRLREHTRSLDEAVNLERDDFKFRSLLTEPVWINLAEEALIRHYAPLWNSTLSGFGIHNPGKGRHAGKLSLWDALHPGRRWAVNLQPRKDPNEAENIVRDFFKQNVA